MMAIRGRDGRFARRCAWPDCTRVAEVALIEKVCGFRDIALVGAEYRVAGSVRGRRAVVTPQDLRYCAWHGSAARASTELVRA